MSFNIRKIRGFANVVARNEIALHQEQAKGSRADRWTLGYHTAWIESGLATLKVEIISEIEDAKGKKLDDLVKEYVEEERERLLSEEAKKSRLQRRSA